MNAARWCFLGSFFLAALSIGSLTGAILAEIPNLRIEGGLPEHNCYNNHVYWPTHPCACALWNGLPTDPHRYDFCSNALPQNGYAAVPAPICVHCEDLPSECSEVTLSCGGTVWNCANQQGTNKCDGGPYNSQWRTICIDTDKPGGCENETFTGCVNGTGGPCG